MTVASAVQSGKLTHVSASQIKLFQTCPRRWYADKVLGVREPPETPDDPRAVGGRIHKQMEDYYLDGVIPTHESAALLVGHPELPPRDGRILIEHPRSYLLDLYVDEVMLKGRADLLWEVSPTEVAVWDWKSKGSFKYLDGAKKLSRDVQLNIYGQYVFKTCPKVKRVWYAHGNILTKWDPAAGETPLVDVKKTAHLDRGHVDEQFESIKPTVSAMKVAATQPDADSVSATAGRWTCNAFNKLCPFASKCSAYAEWQERESLTEPPEAGATSMSLSEKLASLAARDSTSSTGEPS